MNLAPPPERSPAIIVGDVGTQGSGFSWPWVQWFQQLQTQFNSIVGNVAALMSATLVTPGPFADDTAAAAAGVAINGQYYKSTGEVFVRLT